MGKELTFRPLYANEIECRVGNVAKDGSGFFLLLYKNARVDQNILDETFGVWNWQCRYYQVKNTMVCSIGIYNEERKEWIWKDNGGDDDSQMEQVKSELSDSFKRASFCVGIGRELYYSPKIFVKAENGNDKYQKYSVKEIKYDENKRITELVIINDKTKEIVFSYGKSGKVAQNGEKPQNKLIDTDDLLAISKKVVALDQEKQKKFSEWLKNTYHTDKLETLTYYQGKQVLKALGGK